MYYGANSSHLEHGVSLESFLRSSLRLQRGYAVIIVSSAMISKLAKVNGPRDSRASMTEELGTTVDVTLDTSIQLLLFMSESESYKWHLEWAPSYSGLFTVFIGMS